MLARAFAAMLVLGMFLGACTQPDGASAQQESKDALSGLDGNPVPEIVGNDGHNLLAKGARLERAMALAAAVKGVVGKQYCSPIRTKYLGQGKSESYWTIQCHDNSTYQVQIKKDGSGNVMDCADPKSLGLDIDCWMPFDSKSKPTKS